LTIDFHAHAFPDDLAEHAITTLHAGIAPDYHAVLDGTVGGLLASMDRAGIDAAVICSIATAPKQIEPILRWSLSIAGDRIVPFGSVHPDCEDLPAAVGRIADAGLRGIKLHPLYQGFATDDQRLWPLYGAIAERGLVLVMHTGCDVAFPLDDDRASPTRLLAVHHAFPDLKLVAAHFGGWRTWREAAETIAGTDVYLETSYALGQGEDEAVRAVWSKHSPDRVLFGTDTPWRDQAVELAAWTDFLPEAARGQVLHENAARLLGLK
jgi:predicted TIM-barrel fold metal-dependent hydrolase